MRNYWSFLWVVGLAGAGCAHRTTPWSTPQHDSARFANAADAFQWVSLTEGQYEADSKEKGFDLIPADHPVSQHVMRWLTILWQEMRRTDSRLASAPPPKIRIRKAGSFEAFTAPMAVCGRSPITIPTRANPGDNGGTWLIYDRGYATTLTAIAQTPTCLTLEQSPREAQDFVAWLLTGQEQCQPHPSDQGIELPTTCRALGYVSSGRYEGIFTKITHNYITIDQGLIQNMSEAQVVAVIAHELAHYSMAHRTARPGEYSYLYMIPTHLTGIKPKPLEASHPAQQIVKLIREKPLRKFPTYPGQTIHGSVLGALSSLTLRFSGRGAIFTCGPDSPICVEKCGILAARLERSKIQIESPNTPSDSPPTQINATWAQGLEDDIRQCTELLTPAILANSIRGLVEAAFLYKQKFSPTSISDSNLWQSLVKLSSEAFHYEATAVQSRDEAIRAAYDQGIGWYTSEQEADDIATDLVDRMGLPSNTMIGMVLRLAELTQKPDTAKCREMAQKGFPQLVSPGSYMDEHHDFCFRAFNSANERKRHSPGGRESHGPTSPQKLMSPDEWTQLVGRLRI